MPHACTVKKAKQQQQQQQEQRRKGQVTGKPSSVEPAGTVKEAQTVYMAQWLMVTSLVVPE
jgi:hypothetical protein